MIRKVSVFLLTTFVVAIFGCTGKICHPISSNLCIGVDAELKNTDPARGGSKESQSGFTPELGTEVVVSQKLEQKYSCDGSLVSEEKTYKHHGFPQLKINPKRNVPIDRSTFTNLTNGYEVLGIGAGEALKYFRVFVEPKEWSINVLVEPLLAVVRGENRVRYKYETCQKYETKPDDSKQTYCSQWYSEEEGEVLVRVGLTEHTENPEICRRYANCVGGVLINYKPCERANPN